MGVSTMELLMECLFGAWTVIGVIALVKFLFGFSQDSPKWPKEWDR